ncbi:adenylate/guanylate cyclase domain-containing protein [Chryseolinea sp. H1M3-3]|uniref:adenylate/guanylate cyclase domain-containing protein n=1 Tax=Chryseolinea sp. H1M3-3 TaxID=3034144 RepID=UPI0023EB1B30|nr:adenylate/guanylate cyclase domain-containing protein [Chryseolinea sp. H1M3-3]
MQQLTLFSNNTSRSVRKNISKRGRKNVRPATSAAPRWDLWIQEADSEKEMALFFLDIRNFTPLAEKHHAFDVIHLVKKLFSTFHNIIRVHHGQIIETSGDGFYAAFGFNSDVSRAVNDSVNAGMAILKTLEKLNSESFEQNLHQRIDIGIGVHVGKVATGSLHLGSKDHFVVMGYPVNVASRIQAATKELNNNFIVSSEIFKMLKNPEFSNEPVNIRLKGVTDTCDVHLLGRSYGR